MLELNRQQWEQYRNRNECGKHKDGTQGAHWCITDGITGYCDYHCCPAVTGMV